MAVELEGSCRTAGCAEQHRHPLTGEPPEYHYLHQGVRKPVWGPAHLKKGRNPLHWWYRVSEVASACGVHRDTVMGWIHRGLLRASRPLRRGSSRWFIKGSDLEDFLRSRADAYPKENQHEN